MSLLVLTLAVFPRLGRESYAETPRQSERAIADAAGDALARCGYFLAIDMLPYRIKPSDVQSTLLSTCRGRFDAYSKALSFARGENPNDCNGCIDLDAKPEKEILDPYAMLVVKEVVDRYSKALSALRR